MEFVARQILNLPNGLHFQKLYCAWYLGDELRWIKVLVEGCADTLQYVYFELRARREFRPLVFYYGTGPQPNLLLR